MKTTLLALIACAAAITASRALAQDTRVYELRTYHTPPGKLDALHARFRNHSITLLEKHGMKLVGFWVPMDADKGSADTLVYLVEHKSRAAADASWKAFGADPDWVKAKAESEKDGPLTTKVDRLYMSLTDYSRMK